MIKKRKMIEEEKQKDIGQNICIKCGKRLTTTIYKDENEEIVSKVCECPKCNLVYENEVICIK